jgi:hypothetical protein
MRVAEEGLSVANLYTQVKVVAMVDKTNPPTCMETDGSIVHTVKGKEPIICRVDINLSQHTELQMSEIQQMI